LRVVAVDERAVTVDARLRGDVVRLRLADERVDQQAVDRLERDLRQVFVRAVDRVARLKADDALPAAAFELGARLRRVKGQLGKGRRRPIEDGDRPGDVQLRLTVETLDAGMR